MSESLLKYIKESPLFALKYIEDDYHLLSDEDLQRKLNSYRDYCLQEVAIEPKKARQNLSIFVEGFDSFLPDESLLKQCALYVEDVVINDPVFELASPRSEFAEAISSYLGMTRTGIDRKSLARSATYMNRLRPAIQADFVKFLPVSYIHEPPKQIPITYSENWYADALPSELLEWFRAAAEVHTLRKGDKGWYSIEGDRLVPCRAISIHFKGHPLDKPAIYFLVESQVISFDEKTGVAEFLQVLPEDPPDEQGFIAWVFQSMNQTAKHFFDQVCREVYIASRIGSTYLTKSPFTAELLRKEWPQAPDLRTDIFNAVLKLELPVLEGISLERIIEFRQKEGEAFQNFRVELERHLRELRRTTDPDELAVRIQNVTHELSEVQINEIDKTIAEAKKRMFADALLFVGGLVTTIQTNGLSLLAALGAFADGYKTLSEYTSSVRENPAFFLWKLQEKN